MRATFDLSEQVRAALDNLRPEPFNLEVTRAVIDETIRRLVRAQEDFVKGTIYSMIVRDLDAAMRSKGKGALRAQIHQAHKKYHAFAAQYSSFMRAVPTNDSTKGDK